MANGQFNIAKGSIHAYVRNVANNSPATSGLVVVLLKTAEADADLQDHDTLQEVLDASNEEADFTNYARVVFTNAEISAPTIDDGADTVSADMPDPTWPSAGGVSNNAIVKMLVCYAPDTGGAASTFIPLVHLDYAITTDGTEIAAKINAAGFFQA